MNAAIFDPTTSELLQIGALEYLDIARQKRAVDRAHSHNYFRSADELLRVYQLTRDLEAMQDGARRAFGSRLGLVPGKPFTLEELRAGSASGLAEEEPCCAFMGKRRADYFYDEGGKPIAIVGHSRLAWSECHQFAVAHGLEAAALPGSWRSPGGYIAVLYTLRGFVHLPKQADSVVIAVS